MGHNTVTGSGAGELSSVKRALLELREMRARLAAFEREHTEPIAVIGMGCRFPGGIESPDAFWRLLSEGVDAITEVPPDRWDVEAFYDPDTRAAGKISTRWGGFLEAIDTFDPQFFGISPREAAGMDPQQRLLLEVAWEALEHAGQAPERLAGSATGVFMGISSSDYAHLLLNMDHGAIDPYLAQGMAHSTASGRIAYLLGLQGPALSIDTACSSSLVATHLAVQSLRKGECRLALVGGVNLILLPEMLIGFSRAEMMASDGRCKTFDARADGFVRAEGAGVIVLKRLSDALQDRDHILAVIRGSAVNQDGRSSGLTAPNGLAQEAVIRAALADAGVAPEQVGYVETHGTGTALGDPIEVQALGATMGNGRDDRNRLLIGSMKTNLGHLEAAAGVAALMKSALVLQHKEVPPHLHLQTPNPYIPWSELPIDVPVARAPLPADNEGHHFAGVSSFGFSGTNAHVLLGAAPAPEPLRQALDRPLHLLTLSAKSEPALTRLTERYRAALAGTEDFPSFCFTANAGRTHHSHRVAVIAPTATKAREKLASLAAGQTPDGLLQGQVGERRQEVAFLFSGHGSQHPNMGRALYETEPVFRATIDRCEELLAPYLDRPLRAILYPAEGEPDLMDRLTYAQPALFALEYALAALWRAWGIEPAVVLGHSLGECTAACVAGLFSLEDGLKLVATRGRFMDSLPESGQMVVLFTDEAHAAAAIAPYRDRVAIAGINGPENIVISGASEAVEAVVATLKADGIKSRRVNVSRAAHSPLLDPILDECEKVAAEINYMTPQVGLISGMTGQFVTDREAGNATYWRRQIREPVRFKAAMETLHGEDSALFVEIGPAPTLLAMGRRCLPDSTALWLPSLQASREDWERMLESLAALYTHGVPVAWEGFDQSYSRRRLPLPTYPWERQSYWIDQSRRSVSQATAQSPVETLAAAGRWQAAQCPLDLPLDRYSIKWQRLNELAIAYIIHALHQFGLFRHTGERHSVEALVQEQEILPTYRLLLERWLGHLAERGILRQEGDSFVSLHPLPNPNIGTHRQHAREELGDIPFVLAYIDRCGELLTRVLTGKESPLETLFPSGTYDIVEALYHNWALSRYFNNIVRHVVATTVEKVLPGRSIRLIEIGAGTGGTTATVLPALPADRVTYHYTDLSDFFLERAAARFRDYPFVQYGILDIEQPPEAQGYTAGGYDIVVAANVLHATRHIDETLANARSLLTPGGLLVLYETTDQPQWFDTSIALIEGWQRFEDTRRTGHPLLSPAGWTEALEASGFEMAVIVPEAGMPSEVLGQHVLVARLPGSTTAPGLPSPAALEDRVPRTQEAGMNVPAAPAEQVVLLRQTLDGALPDERLEQLVDYVRRHVIRVLRLGDAARPGRRQPLMDLGLDSLMAVEFRAQLGNGLGLGEMLPATLIFDYPTIEAIATLLAERLDQERDSAPPPASPPTSREPAGAVQAMDEAAPEPVFQVRHGDDRPSAGEPIAIVGIGCRFPGGADDPESFWRLLREGIDPVTEVPVERWDIDAYYDPDPEVPGKIATRWGAFIKDVDQFDPRFFEIAPREAVAMDPQQRLLLEVSWEALEQAGVAADRLAGSRTGVFVGITNNDYAQLAVQATGIEGIDAYYASGVAHSVASGRLSYVLGLQGPSLSIDTACSSGLVAVHLACKSLRDGECQVALAGAVNLILSPTVSIALSKYHMLAPGGRCKAFDASADGFVRGDGCGMVVLKRLADAQSDGDRILAVIRGSAVNQDGASSGLTAPNGPSQEAVIRDALADAGVQPHEVSYVEAHGTGTVLGDPIELQALHAVLGTDRPAETPLVVGSVKTNIGHLEVAAGIAGLIKTVLAIQHGEIPPHLHLQVPNPHVRWDAIPLQIPTEVRPWRSDSGRLVAGVSSFGFSGTNSHLILEGAPPPEPLTPTVERPWHLLTLSAKSEPALQALARRYEQHLGDHPEAALADICFTSHVGRAHLTHRLAIPGRSPADLREKLAAAGAGRQVAGAVRGDLPGDDPPKIAFLFSGQGAQYVNMGRDLYEHQPIFRAALDRCNELLRPYLDPPLLSILYPESSESPLLDRTDYTQAALFALQYALVTLWRAWGIEPNVVMGHSVGEYAAACAAGLFDLEDGIELIGTRARLMQALPENGAMAAVFADEATVAAVLAPHGETAAIAAINGPEHVVISGAKQAVQAILDRLASEGIKARYLNVSHAFHSPLVDPVLAEFEAIAAAVSYREPHYRFISGTTGRAETGATLAAAGYWRRHMREPVRFAAAMESLQAQGIDIVMEIGPGRTLLALAQRNAPDSDRLWLASLRQGTGGWQQMSHALAALYVRGASIDWHGYDRDYPRRRLSLPTYPFQRKRYWFEPPDSRRHPAGEITLPDGKHHPLLGRRLRSALQETQFESTIRPDRLSFLNDHRIQGIPLLPATAYVEMALAAGNALYGRGQIVLEALTIDEPFIVGEGESRTSQLILSPGPDGATLHLFSQGTGEEGWTRHASGTLRAVPATIETAGVSLAELQARCREPVAISDHYRRLSELGLNCGPSLQGLQQMWRQDGEVLGQVQLPAAQVAEASTYQIHPALLDACLQLLAAIVPADGSIYFPVGIERFQLARRPGTSLWSHASIRASNGTSGESVTADIRLFDETGDPIGTLEGLQLKRAAPESLPPLRHARFDDWLYEMAWRPQPLDGASLPRATAVPLPAPGHLAAHLQKTLPALYEANGIAGYRSFFQELDRLSLQYIVQSLEALGLELEAGRHIQPDTLADQLGITETHRRLFNRFLLILEEEGILRQAGDAWEIRRNPAILEDPAVYGAALIERYPGAQSEIIITQRCGEQLAGVLRGEIDPLALLFDGGSRASVEKLYRESPFARVYNSLAEAAIEALVEQQTPGTPIRVLEIGAGTGGTTAHLLRKLPAARSSYLFTDISPLFLDRAKETFRDYPFVRYQTLDIEQDPVRQGLDPHQFDLIVASNVVHATRDLGQTFDHIKQLLAPEGLLILLELTQPQRWIDVSFGLTEGWWRFNDTSLRPAYPILSTPEWHRFLASAGFTEVAAIPETEEGDGERRWEGLDHHSLFLARGPRLEQADGAIHQAESGLDSWLILSDHQGMGEHLEALLTANGMHCRLLFPEELPQQGPEQVEHLQRLVGEMADGELSSPPGVIHLWGLDIMSPQEAAPGTWETTHRRTCGSLLSLVQALATMGQQALSRLWVVTRGAQPVEHGEAPAAGQAPLWGIGRVASLEHPDLHCTCLDLDPRGSIEGQALALLEALMGSGSEAQVAIRGGRRYVNEIAPYPTATPHAPAAGPIRLAQPQSGLLDDLTLQPATRKPPGPGEVEIRVRATGLNFRDVMNALSLRDDPEPLGSECAGQIVAIGEDVGAFKIGDEVIAIAPGAFGTFVTAPVDYVVHKPAHLGPADAATLPMAFLTAHYALNHVAGLAAGSRILIHAAAGGVGMAAVQLAQRAGAEIFATAGNPKKRAFLKALGVPHVMDSRTLDFADEIMRLTDGEGVDLVLNALAGEFISRSLSVVADGGCFLEIGKRDIWSDAEVARIKPGVRYIPVDLSEVIYHDRPLTRRLLREMLAAIEGGDLRSLPLRSFPIETVTDAFRYMAQARHIGKIVVTQEAWEQPGIDPGSRNGSDQDRAHHFELSADGTYLITGGLGGLGITVAEWMVAQGARHLALVGRSEGTGAARAAIERLERAGARLLVLQGDVARADAVERILHDLEAQMPPLRGIIHSAGVLDDGVLLRQTWERFAAVMAPKVDGAWNLHYLTRHLPLDFFILFSSIASMLGSPGQANHVAANSFLDALAHYRRAAGLPASSINWGIWSEVGSAAERGVGERVMMQGLGVITPGTGLHLLERLIKENPIQVGVQPIDWQQFATTFPEGHLPSWYAGMVTATTRAGDGADRQTESETPILQRLATAPSNQHQEILQSYIAEQVTRVLGLGTTERIAPQQTFSELGLDSLMAVELRNVLSTGLGVARNLPATLVFDYPTVEALTGYLAGRILPETEGRTPPPSGGDGPADLVRTIETLSDEEIDRLFAERRQGK